MESNTFAQLKKALDYAAENSRFYKTFFAAQGADPAAVQSMDDFRKLPFSDKYDLRKDYPLGLQAVPD